MSLLINNAESKIPKRPNGATQDNPGRALFSADFDEV
jgi:hypothetical protein